MPANSTSVAPETVPPVTLPDALILIAATLFAAGQLLHSSFPLLDLAAAFAAGTALLDWPRLTRIARTFFAFACLVFVAGNLLLAPEQAALLRRAIHQGVGFSCFLSMIGMLRYAVTHSSAIRDATGYLLGVPDRRRYQAVKLGSHALSLLFNVGVVSLIGQMVANATQSDPEQARRRAILLASMRGTVLMTIWSPLGVGFAIITQSIPTLSPTAFMLVAFCLTLGLMLITTLLHTELGISSKAGPVLKQKMCADPAREGMGSSPKLLVLVLAACAGLFIATMALHAALDITPLAATILILPSFTLAWVSVERHVSPKRLPDEMRGMVASMSGMRTESVIYLSASVIGAGAIAVLDASGAAFADVGNLSPLLLAAGCILAIAASAVLFIPHSIIVVFLAQLFGTAAFGHDHPMVLALALSLGWAAGIALSPISAMSITMARLTSVSPTTIVLRWNGRFALTLVASSIAVISLAASLGG